jgi:excisionase family DNA binding protein
LAANLNPPGTWEHERSPLVRDQPSPALPSPDPSVPPGLVEALARAVVAVLSPAPQPPSGVGAEENTDFLTAGELAKRLGVSRETVRRLAIAGVLPHTVVCRGARQTTRRFPRRFADDFAASGMDTADLAGFAVRWRGRAAGVA